MADNLQEELAGLESRRSNMRSQKTWLGGVLATVLAVNWGICYMGWLPYYTIFITVALMTPVLYFIYTKKYLDSEIPSDFKELVVKNLINFVDPSLRYEAEGFIDYTDFAESKLFMLKPDHYTGDDLITGKVDGVRVSFSELMVSYDPKEYPTNRKVSPKLLFHGLFMVADNPNPPKGNIFILASDLYKKFGYVGRMIQKHNFIRGHYVLPQNLKFRDYFVVYADDQLEGEMVLNNNLMEKMLKLKDKAKAKVYISLISDKIYVAVDMRREIFKINLNNPLTKTAYLQEFYDDLYYMLTLVEDLNFDSFLSEHEG